MKIGTRTLTAPSLIHPHILDAFRTVGVAQASDCMGRLYGMVGLTPMYKVNGTLAGRAITIKTRPGDNLLIHKALLDSEPGDVIVVDGGGETTNALFGELMMLDAKSRGVAGLVIDGAIRDRDILAASDFPVFARGVSHRGPYKSGPGELNVPVSVGGQVVFPGDLIIGDADGVLAIRAEEALQVLEQAHKKITAEEQTIKRIQNGENNKPWVANAIAKMGEQL